MITASFIDVPCRCGRRHHVPVPPDGAIQFLCPSMRRVIRVNLGANQPLLQRALAARPSADAERAACVVHRAGGVVDEQQRCEDCNWLLVDRLRPRSRSVFSLRFPGQRPTPVYWPSGALVGRTFTGDYYLARAPLTAARERRCFMRVVS